MGFGCLDYWQQRANPRVIHTELKKMSRDEKVALAQKLLKEAGDEEKETASAARTDEQKKDPTFFLNPFNTAAPTLDGGFIDENGVQHAAALQPGKFVPLKLAQIANLGTDLYCYKFAFPNPSDCSGCVPGQYVRVRIKTRDGKDSVRYFSPTTDSRTLGHIDLVMSFHFEGEMTTFFRKLQIGESLEFEGPAGGFEYQPNKVEELLLVAGGVGVTPCLQLIRHVLNNVVDKTKISLLWANMKETDIIYKDEIDDYANRFGNRLKVHYIVKEATPTWKGKTGYINADMMREIVPNAKTTPLKAVLCGGPAMVTSVLQHMLDSDVKSDDIFIYGPTGDEQLKNVYGPKAVLSSHTL
jgi:cytochrome-b5 reductase